MNVLFLLLFLASIVCLLLGFIRPSLFSRFIKGDLTRKRISLIFGGCIVVFFVLIGITSDSSDDIQTVKTATPKSENSNLPQYKVLPEQIHGTTQIIHVIVQSSIKKDEIIVINNDLIKKYSNGLTHLNIEYFDDETVASVYFQKILKASEAESEKLFQHYIGTYTMNKTSGYNKLNFHEGVDWVTIKQY